MLSGKHISAEKAVEFGLINAAVADEQLQKSVLTMANHLCQNASENSLSATKRLINNIHDMTLDQALELAIQENAVARESEDCKKGICAFLKKEKLYW